MLNSELEQQHKEAFLEAHSIYGLTFSTQGENPETFKAIKGMHGRRGNDDSMIEGFGSEIQDSNHLFWVSAWRSLFPESLLENGEVSFSQGEYLNSDEDQKSYFVEHIPDDTGSPWLRFLLRES